MADVTEADREKAMEIILAGDSGPESWTQVLAAALAEEREKARAPFRKLADAVKDGWEPTADRLADAIYTYTGGYGRDRAAEVTE